MTLLPNSSLASRGNSEGKLSTAITAMPLLPNSISFIEIILNQELGEPFRRDAMKKPVKVAGISKSDMKPQKH